MGGAADERVGGVGAERVVHVVAHERYVGVVDDGVQDVLQHLPVRGACNTTRGPSARRVAACADKRAGGHASATPT